MAVGLGATEGSESFAKAHHGIHQQIGTAMAHSTDIIFHRSFLVGAKGIRTSLSPVSIGESCRAAVKGIEMVFASIVFIVMPDVLYGIRNVFFCGMAEKLPREIRQLLQVRWSQPVQLSVML